MRPPTTKSIKQRAWKAFSVFIRRRDKICVSCSMKGKSGKAEHAGHYRHNSDKANKQLGGNALWYDERNVHGQCVGCNTYASGAPREYALYLEQRYGTGILQYLNKRFNTPKKWTLSEIIKVAEKYEKLNEQPSELFIETL